MSHKIVMRRGGLRVNGMDTIPIYLSNAYFHFVGVARPSKPDQPLVSFPCGRCGAWRRIHQGVMERCSFCGAEEKKIE